jgi:hypothetical protein
MQMTTGTTCTGCHFAELKEGRFTVTLSIDRSGARLCSSADNSHANQIRLYHLERLMAALSRECRAHALAWRAHKQNEPQPRTDSNRKDNSRCLHSRNRRRSRQP